MCHMRQLGTKDEIVYLYIKNDFMTLRVRAPNILMTLCEQILPSYYNRKVNTGKRFVEKTSQNGLS